MRLGWMALLTLFALAGPVLAKEPARLPNGEPILRMPVPAGAVVLCQQGNKSPKGFTHNHPTCLHALDLSNPGREDLPIVASAAGIVAQVVTGVAPRDTSKSQGFGNLVKVDHGRGYHTLYAHLKSVRVKVGQKVVSGQVLGIMGRTGNAGNVHLHFSLHKGSTATPAAIETVPIHAMIAADLNLSSDFRLLGSLEFVGAKATVSAAGHLYASENKRGRAILTGAAPAELRRTVEAEGRALRQRLGGKSRLQQIVDAWPKRGAPWARKQLESLISESPEPEADYWLAVVCASLKDSKQARASLERVVKQEQALKDHPWLLPWTYLRLAGLEEEAGRAEEARSLLEKTLSFPDDGAKGYTAQAKAALARLAKAPQIKRAR